MSARILTCQVIAVEDLNPDVYGVTLQGRDEAMRHAPGQYLELKLDDDLWVPFSIADAYRGDGKLELHIQHWPERENSARLREMLKVANQLIVRLPGGECVLDVTSRRPLLLIAAGTGFAQMKAILEAALAADPQREVSLWWAARERRDFYHEALAYEWTRKWPRVHFHAVTEMAPEEALPDSERVEHSLGRIDTVLDRELDDVSGHDVYLSGSPGMVYACIDVLANKGVKEEQVFSDVFSYAPREPLLVKTR
ncbi:FAD-binding oxidoreductase [Halomonas sp. Bachu 37]|uniref:FAD-binding oxidoreductase n=1 Tax=Halomonas kashgarensis TaxID=3084920 RepID=UPI003217B355